MTATEMHYQFEVLYGQVDNYGSGRFQSHEIQTFLNRAQEIIVESGYSKENKSDTRFFESNEKARRELNELISDENYTAGQFNTGSSALHDNAVFAEMGTDFLYSLKEDCTVSYTDCNNEVATKNAKVKPVKHDSYLMDIDNPFKKPGKEVIWRMDFHGDNTGTIMHELISDSDTSITNYHIRYIKRPQKIVIITNIPCELNESLHNEIVKIAVSLAVESLKLKQFQEGNLQTNNS